MAAFHKLWPENDPEKVCIKTEAVQAQHRKSFLQPSHRDSDTASRAPLRALLDQNSPFISPWHTQQSPSARDPVQPDR